MTDEDNKNIRLVSDQPSYEPPKLTVLGAHATETGGIPSANEVSIFTLPTSS